MRRAWCLLLATVVLATSAAAQTPDAELEKGIAQAQEGDYEAAIRTLDAAAQRLAARKDERQLSRAYLYLAVAYFGLGKETVAKARFRDALRADIGLDLSASEFPPRILRFLEQARDEALGTGRPSPSVAPSPMPTPSPTPTPQPSPPAPTPAASPSDGRATIYFYRIKSFSGGALEPGVFVDDKEAAKMDNGRFFGVTLPPGTHRFRTSDKQSGFTIDMKAGETYYARMTIEPGLLKGHGRLTLVAPEQGAYEIKNVRLLGAGKVKDRTLVTIFEAKP